jgi:uncharacterized protein
MSGANTFMTTEFTPLASLTGGAMIGLAAVLLMLFQGRIAGVSGIAVRMLPPFLDRETNGRVAFVLGLVAAPAVYAMLTGNFAPVHIQSGAAVLVISGLLVGFGSVWGNGCTSGHGVCGLSRLSVRSLVAVAVFMATAMVTVFLTRHVIGS